MLAAVPVYLQILRSFFPSLLHPFSETCTPEVSLLAKIPYVYADMVFVAVENKCYLATCKYNSILFTSGEVIPSNTADWPLSGFLA